MRIQVEISPDQFNKLQEFQKIGEKCTLKELLNIAFTLLKWAIKQKKQGRLILSLDPRDGKATELQMPYLENIPPDLAASE